MKAFVFFLWILLNCKSFTSKTVLPHTRSLYNWLKCKCFSYISNNFVKMQKLLSKKFYNMYVHMAWYKFILHQLLGDCTNNYVHVSCTYIKIMFKVYNFANIHIFYKYCTYLANTTPWIIRSCPLIVTAACYIINGYKYKYCYNIHL